MPKGVTATVEGGVLSANVPAPGSYDLHVIDLCVSGEKLTIEVRVRIFLKIDLQRLVLYLFV